MPHSSEEEQEALSIRWALGLWVCRLENGRWAIFGSDRKLLEIVDFFDPERMTDYALREQKQYEESAKRVVRDLKVNIKEMSLDIE